MIFIYELICKSHSHEVCNAGFLKLYSRAYPDQIINFYADRTHIKYLKNQLFENNKDSNLNNINFKEISFTSGDGILSFIKKYFFLKNEKKKWAHNKTIFLSFDLITLKILEYILKKKNENHLNILLVAHGILESIDQSQSNPRDSFVNPNSLFQRLKLKIVQPKLLFELIYQKVKNISSKFTSIPIKIFFKNFAEIFKTFNFSFVKFVLLSEHIELELKKIKSINNFNRTVVPMPTILKNLTVKIPEDKINFGIIGYGFPEAQLELLSFLEKQNIPQPFNLRLIGLQPDIFKNSKKIKIIKPRNNANLSRAEMENAIKEIHFQIILYPQNSYRLSQSLSIFEALRYQKPILHIKNPCISFYNTKNLPIGIECSDIQDLGLRIKYIIEDKENTKKMHKKFVNNINIVREKYGIENSIKIIRNFYNSN